MIFIKELKRYWYINLKDYKKSIIPVLLNIVIVLLFYMFINNTMTLNYIVAYSTVWILLTSQLGLMQEFLSDAKAKRIKYYFIGNRSITQSYLSRYIIFCIKYSFLYYIFIKFTYFVGIIQYNIRIYDVLLLCIGLVAVFFVNYILSLIMILNKRLQIVLNLFRCLVFYFLISSGSKILPLSYAIHNLGNNFFVNAHFKEIDGVIIILNSLFYVLAGYYFCFMITKLLKYKIVE